jgi:outer membrane protein OmpA-like peptidoglycan-associated protein
VRELSPTAPFALMLAFGYDYDAKPVVPPPPPPAPEPPPPPPPVGRVRGTVIDASTNAPIGDVIVAMAAVEHTPLATNVAGRFTTYELLPSDVQLSLTHPDYNAGSCMGTIPPDGGDVDVQCTLVPLPKTGTLISTARDVYGSPLSGVRVALSGATAASSYTDADGEARIADLAPGIYQVRFESDGHLLRVSSANIQTPQEAALELTLVSKPAAPSVRVQGTDVKAAKLKFEKGSTALAPGAPIVLAELADLLLRSPAAGRLKVQADGEEGLALSRALVIKQGLQDLGVPDAQVEAVGEPAKRVTLTLQP